MKILALSAELDVPDFGVQKLHSDSNGQFVGEKNLLMSRLLGGCNSEHSYFY